MKKEGNKKMPTPRQKVIHTPSYIFVMLKTVALIVIKRKHNTKKHNIYYAYIKW